MRQPAFLRRMEPSRIQFTCLDKIMNKVEPESRSEEFMLTLKKTVAQLIVASSLIASADAFAKYTEVRRLGTNEAICKGGVKSEAEFQAWTAANKDTIAQILSTTNLIGQEDKVMEAIASGNFVEKKYAPGTTFHWMAANKKNVPTAQRERVWAGKEAFVGYEMFITAGGSKFQVVVPKVCCNFSLASVETLPIPAPEPKPAPAPEPKPEPVAKKKAGIVPFLGLMVGSESLKRYEPSWDMDMQDSSGFVGIKVGAKIPVGNGWSLVPSLGVINRTGINDGNVYPETTANLDFGVEKQINEYFFVGAGIGAWNVDESDYREASAFVNVGGGITKKVDWFLEGRTIDADDSGTAVSGGLRLKF